MNMYLVYEYVQAECMETPVNEEDMRLFATPVAAMRYADKRRRELLDDGLCDYYKEFDGWKLSKDGSASCVFYYKKPTNITGEPKEYVEIRINRLEVEDEAESALTQIDADCKKRYEDFLGCKLTDHEYIIIDIRVEGMVLDYKTKEEFFEDYIWLYGYADWSEKLSVENRNPDEDDLMIFLVPKEWLIQEEFDDDRTKLDSFLNEYTAEDTEHIYSKAVLQDKMIFERRE